MTLDPLMSPADVADVLGIPVEEVRRLTRSGEIQAIKLGGSRRGRTRIRPEDLREYQRRQHETP